MAADVHVRGTFGADVGMIELDGVPDFGSSYSHRAQLESTGDTFWITTVMPLRDGGALVLVFRYRSFMFHDGDRVIVHPVEREPVRADDGSDDLEPLRTTPT